LLGVIAGQARVAEIVMGMRQAISTGIMAPEDDGSRP